MVNRTIEDQLAKHKEERLSLVQEDDKDEYGGIVLQFREKIETIKRVVLDDVCRAFNLNT